MMFNFLRKLSFKLVIFSLSSFFIKLILPLKFITYGSPADDFAEWFNVLDNKYGSVDSQLPAAFYNILFPLGIFLGIVGIILAGYAYMTSQGNPEKVKEASEKLSSAVIGVFFIVLSMVLLRVIIKTLIDPGF